MTSMTRIIAVALSMAFVAPAPAQTGGAVVAARQAGVVGERFDGYLGFAATPSSDVRRQVGAINIHRRALYTGLATRRSVTLESVGIAAGCELLAKVAVGEVYMLNDGAWRRRLMGQPAPVPRYCAP